MQVHPALRRHTRLASLGLRKRLHIQHVAYITGGHEYNPPLFHGCQLYGVNVTDGSLIWSELDTSVTSTAIAYSKLVSLNAYDNQLLLLRQRSQWYNG